MLSDDAHVEQVPTIIEQKELLRSFIAGIAITPSKDTGVITWYDLPASLKCSGGTGAVAERMQYWPSREAIRWEPTSPRRSARLSASIYCRPSTSWIRRPKPPLPDPRCGGSAGKFLF
jgi:hypothetical protein